jgi:tetratricopeptide (TPR) repeat protein
MVYGELQKQAAESFKQRKYQESIALYEECIAIEPHEIINYWYLGLNHLLTGDEITAQAIWMSVILPNTSENFLAEISKLVLILESEAWRQIKDQNLNLTKKIYEQIKAINPDHENLDLSLKIQAVIHEISQQAASLFQARKYQDAATKYQEILSWDEGNDQAWNHLAIVYYQQEKYQDAFNSAINAINLDSSIALYHYNIGLILEKIQQIPQAIQAYQNAIALDPQICDAYNKLGTIFFLSGQLEEAERLYQQSIEVNSNYFPGYINLGNIFLIKGQIEKAEHHYQEARRIQPSRPEITRSLDLITNFKNKPILSIRYSGDYFYQNNNYLEAIQYYQKILATPIDDLSFYFQLANCYVNTNQYEEAIAVYQQGINHHPQASILYLSLIWLLQNYGQIQEAIALADRGLQVFPEDLALKLEKVRLMPVVYETQVEVDFYRDRFTKNLENLVRHTTFNSLDAKKNALTSIGLRTNFYFQYQGKNDRCLQQLYGEFVHKSMAENYPQWVQPLPRLPLKAGEKIRVGYQRVVKAH